MFFAVRCVFYRVGDWDDLQIDLHVSVHDGLKTQFAGIVLVFLQFKNSDINTLCRLHVTSCGHLGASSTKES